MTVELSQACELITDGTHYTPPNIGQGVPFLTVKDVGPRGLDFDACSRISEEDYAAANAASSAPKRGDVLFSKDGTVGKVHVVETDDRFAVLSSLAILRPSDTVDSRFLGHMLATPEVLAQAIKRKSGSAIRRIILSDLKQVQIPLPALTEQRRIAAILDRADAIRAKRHAVFAHLDSLTQSIFHEMFGSGSFAEHELGDLAELRAGVGFPPRLQGRSTGDYPMAKVGDIGRVGRSPSDTLLTADHWVAEEDLAVLKMRPVPEGSVLFAKIGEAIRQNHRVVAGRALLLDNNAMAAIPTDAADSTFLLAFLKSVDFYRLASSTTVPSLRKSDLLKLRVPKPDPASIAIFTERIESLRSIVKASDRARATDDGLFASLQRRAFRGEL